MNTYATTARSMWIQQILKRGFLELISKIVFLLDPGYAAES